MKKLKTFEEMGYGNTPLSYDTEAELSSELDQVDEIDQVDKVVITPEGLQGMLALIFANASGVEEVTKRLSYIKTKHPEVKEDPSLKGIWYDAVKKWHLMLKEVE